jgi:GntR family transcriptional regulator
MVVASHHQKALRTRSRVELLRPALEKAAAEARQLELPPDQVLALFKSLLKAPGETS